MLRDLPQRLFDELQRRLPEGALNLPKQELQSLLSGALNKLDLVTREEFDAQCAVLARTRSRLEALEQQLDTLLAVDAVPAQSASEPSPEVPASSELPDPAPTRDERPAS